MTLVPGQLIILILSLKVGLFLVACQPSGGANRAGPAVSGAPGAGTTDPAEVRVGKGSASGVTIDNLKATALFTKEAAENTCATFTVSTLDDKGVAVADVNVKLSIQSTPGMTDVGKLTPEASITDANGVLEANYCSGESEGSVTILATAGASQVNSGKIKIAKKPLFSFTYVRSDVDPTLTPADGESADAGVLYLNLLDSGPQDCTNVYFKLTNANVPIVGNSIKFSTQPDYPKGAKLGKRTAALVTQTNPTSGKKSSVIDVISSGAGEFAVPVCAGVSLGTIVVSGSYTDVEGRVYTAKSPVVRITAGLTNFVNMSLTFDPINGRTMKAYYNTNSDYQLPITVQLGARQDGQPIAEFPVFVAAEVGKVIINNGGSPDKDRGTVDFKINALHLVDNYPYMTNTYSNFPLAQTRCEPQELASWATANAKTEVLYKDLAKNWRSTLVYGIRGQESYNDANRNGYYDVGGDGFWDKNQNGYFDTGDVLTFDAGNDGLFNQGGEWFIDLPSPFIDVDENTAFDNAVDVLVGDEYQAPNAKRDSDTMVWKYEYLPVSMGPSVYGLLRYRVQAAPAYASADALITYGGSTYPLFSSQSITEGVLGVGSASPNAASYRSVIFAHDLCGNALAGGTEVAIDFVAIDHAPAWGTRAPIGIIYMQYGDDLLEPARQFILQKDAVSKVKINFNVANHPASTLSYPIVTTIEVPACGNICTGAVTATPGISCDGFSGFARIQVTEPKLDKYDAAVKVDITTRLNYGAYNGCNCLTDATASQGVCTCTLPKTFKSGACSL